MDTRSAPRNVPATERRLRATGLSACITASCLWNNGDGHALIAGQGRRSLVGHAHNEFSRFRLADLAAIHPHPLNIFGGHLHPGLEGARFGVLEPVVAKAVTIRVGR